MRVHERDDFDITPNPVWCDVWNIGEHNFARALDATNASRGRQVSEHVQHRHDPRDDSGCGIRVVIFDVCPDIIKTPQRSQCPVDAFVTPD